MGCNVFEMRQLTLPTDMDQLLGTSLQDFSCLYPYDPTNESYQPAVNFLSSQCVAEGQSSSCSSTPPPGMRRLW